MYVEADGVTTKGGGRCNLGYATEVLYDRWYNDERRAIALAAA